jgi:protein gp37
MADKSKIERCDATVSPIRARNRKTGKVGWHCEHVSPGCANCYSEGINKRLGTGLPFKPGHLADVELFLDEDILTKPLRWKKPRTIFWNSMTDLFGAFVPDAMIDKHFAVMALTPQHRHIVLTKRPARMREYFTDNRPFVVADEALAVGRNLPENYAGWSREHWKPSVIRGCTQPANWPLPNVRIGVSVEDQTRADERIPDLLATPATVRFCSAEPLLGPIDFTAIAADDTGETNALSGLTFCEGRNEPAEHACLDQVIVGGESGPGARPMQVEWARSIVAQCKAAGTACFVKQLGADPIWSDCAFLDLRDCKGGDMSEWPTDLRVRELPREIANARP